jgi:hypothetical protein
MKEDIAELGLGQFLVQQLQLKKKCKDSGLNSTVNSRIESTPFSIMYKFNYTKNRDHIYIVYIVSLDSTHVPVEGA